MPESPEEHEKAPEGPSIKITFKDIDKIKAFLEKSIETSADKVVPQRSLEELEEDSSWFNELLPNDLDLEKYISTSALPGEILSSVKGDRTLFQELEVSMNSGYSETGGPTVELISFLHLTENARKKGWKYLGSKRAEISALLAIRGVDIQQERDELVSTGPKSGSKIFFGPVYKDFNEFRKFNPGTKAHPMEETEEGVITMFMVGIQEMPLPADPNFDKAIEDFQEITPKVIDTIYESFDLETPKRELVVKV